MTESRWQFLVCEGPTCGGCKFSLDITRHLQDVVREQGLEHRAIVMDALCLGRCRDGPNLLVRPLTQDDVLQDRPSMRDLEQGSWIYGMVDRDRAASILRTHIETGGPVHNWGEAY